MTNLDLRKGVVLLLVTVAAIGGFFVYSNFFGKEQTRRTVGEDETQKVESLPIVSKKVPIILVHGYNQSDEFWKSIDIIHQLKSHDYCHMGNFEYDSEGMVAIHEPVEMKEGESAVYTLGLPDMGTVDIKESAALLSEGIESVVTRHRCETVRLVGFSLGGVVSREYFTSAKNPRVSQFISISSPHLGSEFARVAELYHRMTQAKRAADAEKPSSLKEKAKRELKKVSLYSAIESLHKLSESIHIPIDAKAARMLASPVEGNYLSGLNKREHPENIDYHSIVTEENILTYQWQEVMQDWDKLKFFDFKSTNLSIAALDLLRHTVGRIDKFKKAAETKSFRGDGAVSCQSQDLNQIEAFKNSTKLKAKVHKVESSHMAAKVQKELINLLAVVE